MKSVITVLGENGFIDIETFRTFYSQEDYKRIELYTIEYDEKMNHVVLQFYDKDGKIINVRGVDD